MKGWEHNDRVKAALADMTGRIVGARDAVDPIGKPWAAVPLAFVSLVDPVAWSRATPLNGTAVNAPAYRKAKQAMAEVMNAAAMARRWRPILGAFSIAIIMERRHPARLADAFQADPLAKHRRDCMPTGTPDVDNLAKLVLDAGNGVLWKDDAQAVDMVTRKRFGPVPFTAVAIEPTQGQFGPWENGRLTSYAIQAAVEAGIKAVR